MQSIICLVIIVSECIAKIRVLRMDCDCTVVSCWIDLKIGFRDELVQKGLKTTAREWSCIYFLDRSIAMRFYQLLAPRQILKQTLTLRNYFDYLLQLSVSFLTHYKKNETDWMNRIYNGFHHEDKMGAVIFFLDLGAGEGENHQGDNPFIII